MSRIKDALNDARKNVDEQERNKRNAFAGTNGQPQSGTPDGQPKDPNEIEAITMMEFAKQSGKVEWLWPGWIVKRAIGVVASDPGKGKTRFALDLVKRITTNDRWPCGANIRKHNKPILWIPSDNNHPEVVEVAQEYGIPLDRVLLNADRENQWGGTDLDDVATAQGLRLRIMKYKPYLVVVDTVLNATGLNLTKPEDSKQFFTPLQQLCLRYDTTFLVLCHLNKSGEALGRRIDAQCRTMIKIDVPDPSVDTLRLRVVKSFSMFPPALGVNMTNSGNVYVDPPEEVAEEADIERSIKMKECIEWLADKCTAHPQAVRDLIDLGSARGFGKGTVYRAKQHLISAAGLAEIEQDGRKFWSIGHLGGEE